MKFYRIAALLSLLALSACGPFQVGIEATPTTSLFPTVAPSAAGVTATPTPFAPTAIPPRATATGEAPTITALPPTVEPPTATTQPTPAPTATTAPAATAATAVAVGNYSYLDDRSNAPAVVQSLFNAINRHEYARAYGYWSANGGALAPFDQYVAGYADTAAVDVTIGPVGHDEGAGQLYYSVSALLKSRNTSGKVQTYSACYNLHLGQPGIQGVPPFAPLAIETAAATPAPAGAKDADLLAHACDKSGRATQPMATPTTKKADLSAANYLDDRSDAPEVLYSLFNAINRHEYVRAYTYWEAPTSAPNGVGTFAAFQKGYEQTDSIKITLGKVVSDAGAGNFYFIVPIVIAATTTSGEAQTFSGCYRLHQGNPANYGVPPVPSISVQAGLLKPVPNGSKVAALLATACATQP